MTAIRRPEVASSKTRRSGSIGRRRSRAGCRASCKRNAEDRRRRHALSVSLIVTANMQSRRHCLKPSINRTAPACWRRASTIETIKDSLPSRRRDKGGGHRAACRQATTGAQYHLLPHQRPRQAAPHLYRRPSNKVVQRRYDARRGRDYQREIHGNPRRRRMPLGSRA